MVEPSLLSALLAAAVLEVGGGSPVGKAHGSSAVWDASSHIPVVMDERPDRSATWAKYGLLGAPAGAVVGGAVGHFTVTDDVCVDFAPGGGGCRTERHTVEGALIGGVAGAIVGALIGVREGDLDRR